MPAPSTLHCFPWKGSQGLGCIKKSMDYFAICLRQESGGALAEILSASRTQPWLAAQQMQALFPTQFSCTCSAEETDCWVLFNQRQELVPTYVSVLSLHPVASLSPALIQVSMWCTLALTDPPCTSRIPQPCSPPAHQGLGLAACGQFDHHWESWE